jgi:hypothetical protein
MYGWLSIHSTKRRAKMNSIFVIGGISTKVGDRTDNLYRLHSAFAAKIKNM